MVYIYIYNWQISLSRSWNVMKPRKIKHKRKKVKLAVLNLAANWNSLIKYFMTHDRRPLVRSSRWFFPPLPCPILSLWHIVTVRILTTIKPTKSITKPRNLWTTRFSSFCQQDSKKLFLSTPDPSGLPVDCPVKMYHLYSSLTYNILVNIPCLYPKHQVHPEKLAAQESGLHTCPASNSLPMSIPCVPSDCASRWAGSKHCPRKFYKVDSNDKVTRLRRECPQDQCGPGAMVLYRISSINSIITWSMLFSILYVFALLPKHTLCNNAFTSSCQPRYGHVTTNLSSDHITFDHQWCRVAVHLCKILPPTISGVFMAMHFNRYYCGKCSLTYLIKKEAHERQRENSFAKSNVIRKSCTWQVCGTEHGWLQSSHDRVEAGAAAVIAPWTKQIHFRWLTGKEWLEKEKQDQTPLSCVDRVTYDMPIFWLKSLQTHNRLIAVNSLTLCV